MEDEKLPPNIKAKVDEWLGPNAPVLHFWKCGDTFMIVARVRAGSNLYCLRICPLGDSLQLSQDNVLYPTL